MVSAAPAATIARTMASVNSEQRRAFVALMAAMGLGACAAVQAPAGASPIPQQVAPGVYMLRGAAGEVDTQTLGRIGNAGFIVGDDGVVAIDTGTSYRHGQALLAAIASVTDRPVRLALVTHTRQEFLFGAAAFQDRGIPVQMHRLAARLMATRCETCLKTLVRVLGDEEMQGTRMFKPDAVFDSSFSTRLIGRPLRIHVFEHSSGPGDIAVMDERSRVLFAGGLLDWQRIPDIQDGRFPEWKAALAQLRELAPAAIVPGHGALAPPRAIEAELRYLAQLEARLAELLHADTALSQVADLATLSEFAGWDQAETIHRRNASIVFLRLERERLFRADNPPE